MNRFDGDGFSARLDDWLGRRWCGRTHDTGHIIRIELRGTGTAHCYATGRFDGQATRPVSTGDAFRIASIGKTATAIAALRLVEEGRLRLEDRLGDLLPDDLTGRIHVLGGCSRGRDIKVQQLLNHSSGLFDFVNHSQFRALIYSSPDKGWQAEALLELAIEGGSPLFAPGMAQAYNDTGYVLLGQVIQKISGLSLAQAYRQFVFTPLGLDRTYLEGRHSPLVNSSVSHNFLGGRSVGDVTGSYDTWGGGGLISTAEDLARWARHLFTGKIFSRPETLNLMYRGVPDHLPRIGAAQIYDIRSGILCLPIGSHALWGHTGFWGSFMFYEPTLGLILTGTRNQGDPEEKVAPLFGELLDLVSSHMMSSEASAHQRG